MDKNKSLNYSDYLSLKTLLNSQNPISNINGNIQMGGLSGIVESMADYSEALEFGTSKMGARPFLQPSLEQSRPKMKRLLGKIKVK